jgi:hypothetical protein
MVRFRCSTCSQDAEFTYDPTRRECPNCGSPHVVFAFLPANCWTISSNVFLRRRTMLSRWMNIRSRRIADVRLWILSDIHAELTRGWDLPAGPARPIFDVMIVAGDLIPRAERGVKWLLERVPDRPVIYIMGNHESYGTDIDRTLEKAKAAAAGTNVLVLEDGSVRIGEVTFAGAPLWTDFAIQGDPHQAMTAAAERMNDFRRIRTGRHLERFRPPHALARHRRSRAFIETELRQARPGPLVVVSHHAPVPKPPLQSGNDPALDPAYRSDLRLLMSPGADDGRGALRPPDLWIYGHTHESFEATIGLTRVVSNAKGYGPWPGQLTWTTRISIRTSSSRSEKEAAMMDTDNHRQTENRPLVSLVSDASSCSAPSPAPDTLISSRPPKPLYRSPRDILRSAKHSCSRRSIRRSARSHTLRRRIWGPRK